MTTLPKYRFPLILMISLAITPVIAMYIPRFLAFWPLLIGLGSCCWLLLIKKELFCVSKIYYMVAGGISLLCMISTFWSIAPMQSMEDALKVTALLMFGGLLVSSFNALEFEDFKPYGWLLSVGLIIAALFCIFDLSTDLIIYRIIHSAGDSEVSTAVMNRGIICLVFAFFFTLPFVQGIEWSEKRKFALIAISAVVMVTMLSLCQSQSGQVAFALGLLVFYLFPVHWKLSYALVGVVLLITMLTTPLIVTFLYDRLIDQPQANAWLQDAFVGNRVEIWDFVIKYAMNNPLYGYGIEATNYVRHFEFDHLYNEKDTVLHPHNFSVQLWMEFGLLGVIFAAGVLNTLLYMVFKTEDQLVRKSLTALFIITTLIASMTYGMWQSWWIGELILMVGIGTLLSNQDALE